MIFLDTQVISYAFKGSSDEHMDGLHISSVVANEFLEAHSKDTTSATYYVPTNGLVFNKPGHLGSLLQSVMDRYRKHPFPKYSTDKISLYFGQDYPTVVEYGSIAISRLINAKGLKAYKLSISSLDKRKQRKLKQRFEFLADNSIICSPLNPKCARIGQNLLYEFTEKYTLKKNFRNSLSDILILATALSCEGQLITKDSLLASFCEKQGILKRKKHGSWVRCETDVSDTTIRKRQRESKGYVNRSWEVRMRKGRDLSRIA